MEISITIFATFEISKGATFHQLNALHLKFNAHFSEMVVNIKNGSDVNTNKLKRAIEQVRQQPMDCLAQVNIIDKFIMKQIGTHYALELCTKDIQDANIALKMIDDYAIGKVNRDMLLATMATTSKVFNENSTRFEQPIANTVTFILKTMIPMVIFISLFNILFISFTSKSISNSIRGVINLLSKNDADDDLDEQINKNVSGELRELLTVAKQRIRNDLYNKEMNKELESLVEKRTVSLQRANDELAQFAYRASHDLKAPLSSTKGLAKYINQDIESGDLDEAKANAKKICAQMERLENLVVDILSLAKADLGSSNKEAIDFAQIMLEVKGRLSWLIEKNDIDLIEEVNISETVMAEKPRIAQIIENLVSNSIKYRDAKKESSFVKIKAFDNAGSLSLLIEDNGLGIPTDEKDQAFKIFKRFHPNVSSGSGLGLSIIKKHVDYMNGNISFDSSQAGTLFTIQIPK